MPETPAPTSPKPKKKFDQEPGSIDSQYAKLPRDLKLKYIRNRYVSDLDFWALEDWAAKGFTSGDETVHNRD